MARRSPEIPQAPSPPRLVWQRASYRFHSYAYRDPRSAFASGIGLPVVSPTTVLLGIVSTLFSLGDANAGRMLLSVAHQCEVLVDAPDGVVFFRAFHQLRRYETMKYGPNPRFGLTKINQGTREYGLVDGAMTLYVGAPEEQQGAVGKALANLRHLGTSDSLCSLVAPAKLCSRPGAGEVMYAPAEAFAQEIRRRGVEILGQSVTVVTLSRFKPDAVVARSLPHWKMAGGDDTELLSYVIPGTFVGTSRGRIYRKRSR